MARCSFINAVVRFFRRRGDYFDEKIWSDRAKNFIKEPRRHTIPMPITGEVARLLPCILAYYSHYDGGQIAQTSYLAITLVEDVFKLNRLSSTKQANIWQDEEEVHDLDKDITELLEKYGGLHIVPRHLRGKKMKIEACVSEEFYLARGRRVGGITLRDFFFWYGGGVYIPQEVLYEWTKIKDTRRAYDALVEFLGIENENRKRRQIAKGTKQKKKCSTVKAY